MGQGKLEPGYSIHEKTIAHWEWRDGESGTYPTGKGPPKRGGVLSGGADLFMQCLHRPFPSLPTKSIRLPRNGRTVLLILFT